MPARARFDKDYYGIMGLAPNASEEEIRKAYRRLALQWHPDRNRGDAGAAERFKEISEAYAVLIDPAKRTAYDRARAMGATPHFGGTREDLFRDLFANPRASAVFEDLAREFERMGLRIDRHSFHQTLFGGRTVVSGGVVVITPFTPVRAALRLFRAAVRGRPEPAGDVAPTPSGSSSFLSLLGHLGRRLFGLPAAPPPDAVVLPLRVTSAEAARGGRKRVVVEGDGGRDDLLVTVPPGTRAGTRLRLRGKGRPGANGTRGDLYLTVEVADAD